MVNRIAAGPYTINLSACGTLESFYNARHQPAPNPRQLKQMLLRRAYRGEMDRRRAIFAKDPTVRRAYLNCLFAHAMRGRVHLQPNGRLHLSSCVICCLAIA